ncbi:alkyl hydroperoxide reductase subunit F, partial [Pseudomonas syringae pv. tagetis]
LALLNDVISVSKDVTQNDSGTDARTPSFSLTSPGHEISLRFAGIPMGHEFTSMVLALQQVGGYPPKVSAETNEQDRALKGE